MLVRSFKIEVGGESQPLVPFQDGGMSNPGIEPHVQNIRYFHIAFRLGPEQLRRIEFEPCINTRLLYFLRGRFDQALRVRVQFPGFPVDEHRDRHSPGTLSGNTPVAPLVHHVMDTLPAPIGRPAHPAD